MHSQRHATEAVEVDGRRDNVFKSEQSCKNLLVWEVAESDCLSLLTWQRAL